MRGDQRGGKLPTLTHVCLKNKSQATSPITVRHFSSSHANVVSCSKPQSVWLVLTVTIQADCQHLRLVSASPNHSTDTTLILITLKSHGSFLKRRHHANCSFVKGVSMPPDRTAGATSTSPLDEYILQGRKDTESFDSEILHRKTGLTLDLNARPSEARCAARRRRTKHVFHTFIGAYP